MKCVSPAYMTSFSCLMGKCKHTCCAGWEIDIDDQSFKRYLRVQGAFGAKLKQNIVCIDGQPQFLLDESERCPFLTADGLCEMILTLGEDSLCQICTDHPRFRNEFSDRIEEGLGMCCEAAAQLILAWKEPVSLCETGDCDEETRIAPDEQRLLADRGQLFLLLQDRRLPVEQRVAAMLSRYGMTFHQDADLWRSFFLNLERLDDTWDQWLERLRFSASMDELNTEALECAFEQLLCYLLYRHLPGALQDGLYKERIYFTALIWWLLRTMLAVYCQEKGVVHLADMIELCRLYSSEIEYSDENLYAVLDEITEWI